MSKLIDTLNTIESIRGFPTHKQSSQFWEHLGRCIASYGFLEEILGKAIFVLEGNVSVSDNIDEEIKVFHKRCENALKDPLGGLIKSYKEAAIKHCNP